MPAVALFISNSQTREVQVGHRVVRHNGTTEELPHSWQRSHAQVDNNTRRALLCINTDSTR